MNRRVIHKSKGIYEQFGEVFCYYRFVQCKRDGVVAEFTSHLWIIVTCKRCIAKRAKV